MKSSKDNYKYQSGGKSVKEAGQGREYKTMPDTRYRAPQFNELKSIAETRFQRRVNDTKNVTPLETVMILKESGFMMNDEMKIRLLSSFEKDKVKADNIDLYKLLKSNKDPEPNQACVIRTAGNPPGRIQDI